MFEDSLYQAILTNFPESKQTVKRSASLLEGLFKQIDTFYLTYPDDAMLIELIYYSTALPNLREADLQAILAEAIRFNEAHDVTGCLFFHEVEFVQILEGEQKVVEALYEKIKRDPRHTHVTLVSTNPIQQRNFAEWRMAFRWLEKAAFAEAKQVSTDQEVRSQLPQEDLSKGSRLFSILTRYI